MNINYFENEDNVFVTQDNGDIKQIKNTGSIEERLIIENDIEQVNKQITINENSLSNVRKNITLRLTTTNSALIAFIIISAKYFEGLLAPLFTIFSSTMIVGSFFEKRANINQLNKLISLLKDKKNDLEEELEKVILNEENRIANNINKNKINEIPLNSMQEEFEAMVYYSKNYNKLQRLYKKNKLDKFLSKKDLNFQEYYIKKLLDEDMIIDVNYVDASLEKENKKGFTKRKK